MPVHAVLAVAPHITSRAMGATVAAVIGLVASPYLAGLTCTVPDQDNHRWWRFMRTSGRRCAATALTVVVLGALGDAASGSNALLPAFVTLALTGAPLVIIDFEVHRLPTRLVYPMTGAATVLLVLAAGATGEWHSLLRAGEASAIVFAVLFVIFFVSPRSFGRGDVRVGGVVAGYLGWFGWLHVFYGIFAGFVLGAVVAVVLLAVGRADRKTPIPFGPMLLLGPLVVLAFDLVPQ